MVNKVYRRDSITRDELTLIDHMIESTPKAEGDAIRSAIQCSLSDPLWLECLEIVRKAVR